MFQNGDVSKSCQTGVDFCLYCFSIYCFYRVYDFFTKSQILRKAMIVAYMAMLPVFIVIMGINMLGASQGQGMYAHATPTRSLMSKP